MVREGIGWAELYFARVNRYDMFKFFRPKIDVLLVISLIPIYSFGLFLAFITH